MQNLNSKTSKVLLTLGLAIVLAAGGVATASNMGFKFVKNYTAVDPQVNTISLPYFQTQFVTIRDLFNDLGVQAVQVCKVNATTGQTCWIGDGNGGPNAIIVNSAGLKVGVSAPKTQVIVGSHDPALNIGATFTLVDPAAGYLTSMPYHMTYITIRDIFNDIPGAKQVCKLNAPGGRTCWIGDGNGGPNVNVAIGEAYFIGTNPAAPTWIPDHY